MHKDTVTIFNRKKGTAQSGDVWYPTILNGVNLNIDRAAILAKYGLDAKDGAALSVPYKIGTDGIEVAGKPWMPPKQWDGTEDSITFSTGGDFFWWGEWTGGIVSDSDYGADGFYGFMNRERDYVFAISAVGGPYTVIPHFEILGK